MKRRHAYAPCGRHLRRIEIYSAYIIREHDGNVDNRRRRWAQCRARIKEQGASMVRARFEHGPRSEQQPTGCFRLPCLRFQAYCTHVHIKCARVRGHHCVSASKCALLWISSIRRLDRSCLPVFHWLALALSDSLGFRGVVTTFGSILRSLHPVVGSQCCALTSLAVGMLMLCVCHRRFGVLGFGLRQMHRDVDHRVQAGSLTGFDLSFLHLRKTNMK